MPEQLESVLYGTKSFDLSTDRAVRDDFELIRFPTARALTPLNVPDECYLHFGDKDNPGLDLRDYVGQQFNVLGRKTIGAVYLENPTGATGTLELFYGTEVGVEANPEIGEIGSILSTVTADVSDRSARELGKARLEESGGTLIDPAENLNGLTTSDSTTSNDTYASIDVPNGRSAVTILWDVSGAATLTVEGSVDGTNWFDMSNDFGQTDPTGTEDNANTSLVGVDHIRFKASTNVNRVAVSAKGA